MKMTIVLVAALAFAPVAVVAGPANAPEAKSRSNKVTCKRQVETGSFAKTTKVCKTRAQWQRISEDSKDMTRQLQNDGLRLPPAGG